MTGPMAGAVPGLGAIGIAESFAVGEHERAEQVIDGLKRLGCQRLRTVISWADYCREQGPGWYSWLLPGLAREFELLPCVHYTPPSLGILPSTAAAPRDPERYTQFLDRLVDDYGKYFEWIQLWHEPNSLSHWDWRHDPQWSQFARLAGSSAYWMSRRGKRPVLGGMCPSDPGWLDLMCARGIVGQCQAIAVHAFPGTWQHDWQGWRPLLDELRQVTDRHGLDPEVWITEAGYSTWRWDDKGQVDCFLDLAAAPVERAYWRSYQDLDPARPTVEGFHFDERHYHFGLVQADGTPKLLHRLLTRGPGAVKAVQRLHRPAGKDAKPVVITGGAGFLGANLANRLAHEGRQVLIYDNLSRPGVETNLAWLAERHGKRVRAVIADIRDPYVLAEVAYRAEAVFHFAAQVAVTTSVANPGEDFDINLRGTFNLLEACRRRPEPPPLLMASTNKVYGKIGDLALVEREGRYRPTSDDVHRHGVGEDRPLEFWSPYGCSKGAADQYVLDYARIYGVPAVVFRMSCLYGQRQFGTEDQGWVAHFLISALAGEPITIYGDGKQVRDVLYVDDVVDAYVVALRAMPNIRGRAFNIGGGPMNAVSLVDVLDIIERRHGERPQVHFDAWRPGDQLYYVSDIRAFAAATGWRPRVDAPAGIARLDTWLRAHWQRIAALRRAPRHEGRPAQSELELRRQYLLRLPGGASAAGVRLCEGLAGEEGPRRAGL